MSTEINWWKTLDSCSEKFVKTCRDLDNRSDSDSDDGDFDPTKEKHEGNIKIRIWILNTKNTIVFHF